MGFGLYMSSHLSGYIYLHNYILEVIIYLEDYLGIMVSALVEKVVGISIGIFVAAIILPLALVTMANATWTGTRGSVDPTVKTVATILLPVLAVIGIALYFLYRD